MKTKSVFSIYRGPLLLVHEEESQVTNSGWSDFVLDANTLNKLAEVVVAPSSKAQVQVEISQGDKKIYLHDYGTAGINGKQYKSWLNVCNTSFVPFSTNNPGRSWQP